QEQFDPGRVGADAHVDHLPGREVPVGENMYHRTDAVISPFRLVDVVGIFLESRRVELAEIRILRMVRRRLPDVIEAGPQKLARGVSGVAVGDDAPFRALRAPARGAV